jgi:hypothetical protein
MTDQNEQELKIEYGKVINIYEDERIKKCDFIKLPMWFDKDEDSPTLQSKFFYSLLFHL